MIDWITNLVIQASIEWSLLIIFLVSFFESLALVGLILPGAILMASLGTMIGSNHIGLYPAWVVGSIGCLLGDWLSYYFGWQFKEPLNNWKFLKKYEKILKKIKHALYKYSLITIISGRFIGHTRPLVPLIAGMIGLPIKKFLLPNIIGCIFWPPVYFIPGILAGIIIDIPQNKQHSIFKLLLFTIIIIFWIGVWLCWRWKNFNHKNNWLNRLLSLYILRWLAPLFLITGIIGLVAIQYHPIMMIFHHLLWNVFISY